MGKAGYEYLLTYQQSTEIEWLVDQFCEAYLEPLKNRRLIAHMVDCGRSMARNIAEGYTRLGLKDYIEFLSFSRASGEELLKDLQRLAEKWMIKIERGKWERGDKGVKREIPFDPLNPSIPLNYIINLVTRTNYLLDRQIESLEQKFIQEGGYTESLAKKRREFRGY